VKDAKALYQQMKEEFCQETGFAMEDGADLAVRLYACAAQLESLYRYADWCVEQAFPQTAQGEQLALHGALRGLDRNQGACAEGVLRFFVPEARQLALTIPEGTVCMTSGLQRYVTTQAGTIPAGSLYGDVPARAEEPGQGGNTPVDTVRILTLAPTGVTAVTNPEAFTGGSDAESDEHFRARILESFRELPNGANAAWYRLRAMDHDGVAAAVVLPRVNGIGTVGVVIATQEGAPGEALLEEVREDLQNAREIAVDVTVSAPVIQRPTIKATIQPADGWSFASAKAAAQTAIRSLFGGERLGQGLNRARIIAAVMGTGAVSNCTLTQPTKDLQVEKTGLLLSGSIVISEGA